MPARHTRRAAVRRTAAAGATAVAAIIGAVALPAATAAAADSPETAYLHAINAERQAHGLAPLTPRHSLNSMRSLAPCKLRWMHFRSANAGLAAIFCANASTKEASSGFGTT